ncbi:hypothetical protein [Albidovulum sp.]|uniref:hypothetical protein n=1 Tax=Albidovulum sp. TaxID=1872424 RepID=UPI0035297CD3
MSHTFLAALVLAMLAAAPVQAASCVVQYKAKHGDPLKLEFASAELPAKACQSKEAAARALQPILAERGWTLLRIVSILGAGNEAPSN